MLYVIICHDNPANRPGMRAETRPAHLAYLESLGAKLRLAGPMFGDDGASVLGSMIVIEADSLDAARSIAAADPYAQAGVFANVEIRAWKQVVGTGTVA
jgi:uncharacterized protein YciI